MPAFLPSIRPLGERAVLVELGPPDTISAASHRRVRSVYEALRRDPLPGVTDLVPAYTSIAVHYDPVAWATGADDPGAVIARALEARVSATADVVIAPGRLVEIPVRYGGADGPDLGEVAAHAGLTESQVAVLHASVEYDVYMVGFSPGFPYLAGLPERLAMPRRSTPRVRVPAGSVAIGGRQTGVYPLASPGGWRLIGRTPLALFDPRREPPVLLSLGDRVRFVPMEA